MILNIITSIIVIIVKENIFYNYVKRNSRKNINISLMNLC